MSLNLDQCWWQNVIIHKLFHSLARLGLISPIWIELCKRWVELTNNKFHFCEINNIVLKNRDVSTRHTFCIHKIMIFFSRHHEVAISCHSNRWILVRSNALIVSYLNMKKVWERVENWLPKSLSLLREHKQSWLVKMMFWIGCKSWEHHTQLKGQ